MGELSIPNKSKGITGNVSDIVLYVTGSYSFSSSTEPDECILRVIAGTSKDSMGIVKGSRIQPGGATDSGTETIEASILGVNGIDSSLFDVPNSGDSVTETLWIGLEFEVLKNGETIATDSVKTDVKVSITNESITISTELGGSGGLTVHT